MRRKPKVIAAFEEWWSDPAFVLGVRRPVLIIALGLVFVAFMEMQSLADHLLRLMR